MIYKHLDRVFGLEDFSSSVRFSSQDEAKMFESPESAERINFKIILDYKSKFI